MSKPSRPLCPQCLRPQRACLCRCARPVQHRTELLVLQHPLEQHEAKGTLALLRLCLHACQVEVGEQFEPAALRTWLSAPGTWLLYPPQTQQSQQQSQLQADAPAPQRLVVLDATWRKSRKMLALNPLLQDLPRLALHTVPASRYAIRRAHAPHQLSTLEAVGSALAQIEAAPDIATTLLEALDAFVTQHGALQAQNASNRFK